MLISLEAIWQTQSAAISVPADPSLVTVPSASWVSNQLSPFGNGVFTGLSVIEPNTNWARATALWMRRFVTLDGQAPLLIRGTCRQAFYMYFDGVYVGTFNPSNANIAGLTDYSVVIPLSIADAGSHELALLCLDDAAGTFGPINYIALEADYAPPMLAMQPEAPVSETLVWLTDVAVSNDGTEDRLQVTSSPRYEFDYTYPANAERKVYAFNTFWGTTDGEWLIPVWTQAQRLGAVASGLTTITGVDPKCELWAGRLALLWQSDKVWQLVGIESFVSTTLNLSNVTEEFANAWLMPVHAGFTTDNVTRKLNGYEASFNVTFVSNESEPLESATPTQFLSNDIYTDEGLLRGNTLSDDIVSSVDKFDQGFGKIEVYGNWTHNKIAHSHYVICEDAEETWELREFLHRRSGRYRPFWQPSFENDLRLQSVGTVVGTVLVSKDEYLRYATDRTHLAFDVDGTWFFRTVTAAAEVDANTIQLSLDTALNVAASAIQRISWLGLKRLNTDRVQIRFPGNATSESEFRLMEITP